MLSDNRGTYVSRISTHIDIAPATNHNKQHWILIIMQQNCQITRCARQHTMDSVLKSAKLRRDLTGNRTGFTHARSALRGRVSPKLDELLGDTIEIQNRIRADGRIDLSTAFVPRNIPFIAAVAVFRLVLKRVWRDIRDSHNGGHCWLTVGGRLRRVKIGGECVKYAWLSCPARPSRWVLCISLQWLTLKGCHVPCDECASGEICSHQHMWVTGLSYGQSRVACH